jgi:hypothetical protein
MSTAVYAYLVPVAQLRAVPGSRDETLLTAVAQFTGFLKSIDELARHADEDEKPPRCVDAARQIIYGEPLDDRYGYVYGYAYEAIGRALGTEMERSWTQIARSYDWFKVLEEALKTLTIPLRVTDLVGRGPLFDLPEPDDFPGLGWWTADELAAAARAFAERDLNRLDSSTTHSLGRVAEALDDIRSWVMAAHGTGHWLVGVQS